MHLHHTIELPRLRSAFPGAVRTLIEGTVVPLALFYGGLQLLGLRGAIIAALGWAYATIAVKLATGARVSGVLILTALLFTIRAALALTTGSVFVYFLQPTLGTLAVAAAFLVSVPLKRPLAARLAHDFLPLPEQVRTAPWLERFFLRISLLWALVFLTNGALSLWLLMTRSVGAFLLARTAVSAGLTLTAIAVSTVAFLRVARAHQVAVRLR